MFQATLLVLAAPLLGPRTDRPNLVTIVTDDQGRWAVGAYGNPEVRTPNIDRLAAEGVRFTNAIAATPVCSPSRGTWMSGLYPTELGFTDWISPAEAREGLGLSAPTWAEALAAAGYRTALVGKWHLGEAERFHPRAKGFERFFGFLGGGNRPMDPTLEVEGETRRLEGPLPDLLVDDAIGFLEERDERPFALAVHFRAPHLPYGPVPDEDSAPFADLDPTIPTSTASTSPR